MVSYNLIIINTLLSISFFYKMQGIVMYIYECAFVYFYNSLQSSAGVSDKNIKARQTTDFYIFVVIVLRGIKLLQLREV